MAADNSSQSSPPAAKKGRTTAPTAAEVQAGLRDVTASVGTQRAYTPRVSLENAFFLAFLGVCDKATRIDLQRLAKDEDFGRSFKAISERFPFLPCILDVGETSRSAGLKVIDTLKKGIKSEIVKEYFRSHRKYFKAEKAVAVVMRTRDGGPVVVHNMTNVSAGVDRDAVVRLLVPTGGRHNMVLTIENVRSFCELFFALTSRI